MYLKQVFSLQASKIQPVSNIGHVQQPVHVHFDAVSCLGCDEVFSIHIRKRRVPSGIGHTMGVNGGGTEGGLSFHSSPLSSMLFKEYLTYS